MAGKTSDAQKRATERWRAKNKRTQRVIEFYAAHEAELAHLDAQPKKSEYVRGLIAQDMKGGASRQAALREVLAYAQNKRETCNKMAIGHAGGQAYLRGSMEAYDDVITALKDALGE